ncbi:unnamed protein product [Arabis nemorensis]|uniref:Uncharacterized protein n=1 Tax=Arabis nemorensis TaxID=586526 RepID=A0A565B3A4_9BRAS|nr:unnamed protein product [Arabis nemorensis]
MKNPPPPPKPPDPPERSEPLDPSRRGTASLHLPPCHHLRLLLTVDNTSQSPDSIPAPATTRSIPSPRAHHELSVSISLEDQSSCSGLGSPTQSFESSDCMRSHPHLHDLTCLEMSYGFLRPSHLKTPPQS